MQIWNGQGNHRGLRFRRRDAAGQGQRVRYIREGSIDESLQRLCGAASLLQMAASKSPGQQIFANAAILASIRSAESINRLLGVADNEKLARFCGAVATE